MVDDEEILEAFDMPVLITRAQQRIRIWLSEVCCINRHHVNSSRKGHNSALFLYVGG